MVILDELDIEILVTDISGHAAKHVIDMLLGEEYKVIGTTRCENDRKKWILNPTIPETRV